MKTCVICGRPAPARHTCGNSYCQEADFYQNQARNTRKGTKAAAAAWTVANEKTRIALLRVERLEQVR